MGVEPLTEDSHWNYSEKEHHSRKSRELRAGSREAPSTRRKTAPGMEGGLAGTLTWVQEEVPWIHVNLSRKQTHRQRARTCVCPGGGVGGTPRECGVSQCKLLSQGWMNSQVLPQSTGKETQQPVTSRNGKNVNVCISMYLKYLAAHRN